MGRVEPSPLDILQIRDQDLVIHDGAVLLGPEVVHRVEVRHIHTAVVGLRALAPILIHVHAEQDHVLPICRHGKEIKKKS